MAPTKLTLEGGKCYVGGLARLRLDTNVCIGWFTVYRRSESAVVMTSDEDIEKCDGLLFLLFTRELDSAMYVIETFVKILNRVSYLFIAASEAGAFRRVHNSAPAIIHVDFDVPGHGLISMAR